MVQRVYLFEVCKGWNLSDCYLRQGDGGTKTACFGSKNCFLKRFENRSEAYFGEKSKEPGKTIKQRCICIKNDGFPTVEKRCLNVGGPRGSSKSTPRGSKIRKTTTRKKRAGK